VLHDGREYSLAGVRNSVVRVGCFPRLAEPLLTKPELVAEFVVAHHFTDPDLIGHIDIPRLGG
jgi:hypothetical protein